MRKQMQKLLAMLLLVCLFIGMIPTAMAAAPQTLYLKVTSDWKQDGARFAAYFWNTAGGNAWANTTDSDGDGYYEVSVPSGMTSVLFARMNGSTTENNWDNRWNQTQDQTIPTDGKNCFVLDAGWEGTGSWTTHGNVEPTTPTTPSEPTDSTTPIDPIDPPNPDVTVDNIQDGSTLHCWNWSFADIEKHMPQIAAQGYTAVQTSPIQQAKEATVGNGMKSHWWVFYQPANFYIDTTTGSALGTKAQFESMCETAHKYGVKVIVDVVANHLGNKTGNNLADTLDPDIKNDSSCWHDISKNTTNYNDRYDVTQHCMAGLPDLNTSNKKIQNYALNFLKECIDAGADGFRFDGAKHIETPEDSGCGSDFWPYVINGATEYAKSSRGIDLYCYGEVLDAPGGGLSITAYTKYMSVTDNSWGNSLRGAVNGGNAGGYSSSYHKGAKASQLVVWAESHDTYANDSHESTNISVSNINKTWALVAARADVMGLYFARPANFDSAKLGQGDVTGWSYPEVKAVNEFHNLFVGTTEYLANENGIAYCERGNAGVVLVNCNGTSCSVNVKANKMADGTYIDTITGNTFTVSGGRISGQIGSTGIAVVYSGKAPCQHPSHDTNGTCSECGGKASHTYVNGKCSVCGIERPAISGDYYLFGWINGANYACEEDSQNMGQYKLVNGTLTTKFNQDSYVAVKSADNSNWYMTDGFPGMDATSATLYNTSKLGTTADKLYVPGGVEVTFTLIDNGDDTFTLSYAPPCSHSWKVATCTTPKTCTKCGETEGKELGHSYVDGKCTACGAADPNYVVPVEKFDIPFSQMELGNALNLHFLFPVSACDDWTGAYAVITKSYADGRADVTVTVPAADWGAENYGVDYHDAAFTNIAAKEMTDEITIVVYNADGVAISNPRTDSIRNYLLRNLENYDSAELRALVVDMLNYGAAAQEKFGYNTDDLANKDLTAEQKAFGTATMKTCTDKRVKGANFLGTGLELNNSIVLNMYFNGLTSDMTAKVTFTDHNNQPVTADAVIADGIVYVDQIVVADARQLVTVTVYDANGSVYGTATDSLESCVARASASDTIYQAIMKFADSAYNYLH